MCLKSLFGNKWECCIFVCIIIQCMYFPKGRQQNILFSSLIKAQVVYYKAALKFFHSIITGDWLALHYCLSPCLEFTTRCLLFLLKMSVSGRD